MNEREFDANVRELLEARDRARRGQLFRPDRAIEADARFAAAVRGLVEARAAEIALERARTAPEAPSAPRTPLGKGATPARRTSRPRAAKPAPGKGTT